LREVKCNDGVSKKLCWCSLDETLESIKSGGKKIAELKLEGLNYKFMGSRKKCGYVSWLATGFEGLMTDSKNVRVTADCIQDGGSLSL
jgi:hypothetical protein